MNIMKYLLTVSFNGAEFCGWQFQPGGRSVQKVLTDVSELIFKCKCSITGCSRTDSGVHALGFKCTVTPENVNVSIPADRLPLAYSSYLPDDVSVLCAEIVPDDFHPRYCSVRKEYEYRILNSPVNDPFLAGRAYKVPAYINDSALEKMNKAGGFICGTHDFTAFMASGSKITDAVRTVYFCRAERNGDLIRINVSADGFLYNMVRIITGTLLEVARGSVTPEDIVGIINSKDRKKAGATAPAYGLYLKEVNYL